MKILVFNCGSSSLKFRLIEIPGEKELIAGEAQRVGPPTAEPSRILYKIDGQQQTKVVPMQDHHTALGEVMKLLQSSPNLVPDALGHRVVHGGQDFSDSVLVTDAVLERLARLNSLAPLHQPHNLAGIRAFRQAFPALPQVACFDTAFHAGLPDVARAFALPQSLTEQGVRRYGSRSCHPCGGAESPVCAAHFTCPSTKPTFSPSLCGVLPAVRLATPSGQAGAEGQARAYCARSQSPTAKWFESRQRMRSAGLRVSARGLCASHQSAA